jgi:hypothetical protein
MQGLQLRDRTEQQPNIYETIDRSQCRQRKTPPRQGNTPGTDLYDSRRKPQK